MCNVCLDNLQQMRGWDLSHSLHRLDLWEITPIGIFPDLKLQKNELD